MGSECSPGSQWCLDAATPKINYVVVVDEAKKKVVHIVSASDTVLNIKNTGLREKWDKKFQEIIKQYPHPHPRQKYDIISVRYRDLEHFRLHNPGYSGWKEAKRETLTGDGKWKAEKA